MAQPIGGPGLPLPLPQNLYPSELFNAPYDFSNGVIELAPGATLQVPAGVWTITLGTTLFLQFLDPANNVWRNCSSAGGNVHYTKSDGFNYRIANLNLVPYSGTVAAGGSGYTQAGVVITPSLGDSVWQPIIGGALGVSTINAPGSGFQVQPIVFIPGPPAPANCFNSPANLPTVSSVGFGGVQATAYATLTSHSVSGVTMGAAGAGYTTSVVGLLLPSPFDPNFGNITPGTVTFTTTASGSLTAALLLNGGTSVASSMSLTVSGGGGSAGSATPVFGTTSTVTYDTCQIQPAP